MWGFRWGFDLIGMNWVHGLSFRLNGPDVEILRDEEDSMPPQYFFASAHLEELSDPVAVASRASALMVLFDGAMFLTNGLKFRTEKLGDLVDFKADRRLGGVAGVVHTDRPFSEAIVAQPLRPSHEDAVSSSRLEGSIFLARADTVVRGMLTMLGTHGVTFTSLYALRDFMKTHGFNDSKIAAAGSCTAKELNLFTHTANSFGASGPAARHGDLGQQAPPKPMELSRAAEIILEAARQFVDQRIRAATAARLAPKPPLPGGC